jgi:hypothetical protein
MKDISLLELASVVTDCYDSNTWGSHYQLSYEVFFLPFGPRYDNLSC